MSGRTIIALVLAAAVAAYFILALRLPANLALALAGFGACVAGLLLLAFRLAAEDRHRHDH